MGEFLIGLLAFYLIAFIIYTLVVLIAAYWYLIPVIAVVLFSIPAIWVPLYRRSDAVKSFIDTFAVFTFVYSIPLGAIGFLSAQRSVGIYRLVPGGFASGEVFRMILPPILGFAFVWALRRVMQPDRPPGPAGIAFGLLVFGASIAPLAVASNGRLWGDPADVPAATADGVISWFWTWSALMIGALLVLFVAERAARLV
jgi:hypothetical protein